MLYRHRKFPFEALSTATVIHRELIDFPCFGLKRLTAFRRIITNLCEYILYIAIYTHCFSFFPCKCFMSKYEENDDNHLKWRTAMSHAPITTYEQRVVICRQHNLTRRAITKVIGLGLWISVVRCRRFCCCRC